jgi:hypothetical protein
MWQCLNFDLSAMVLNRPTPHAFRIKDKSSLFLVILIVTPPTLSLGPMFEEDYFVILFTFATRGIVIVYVLI